MIVLAAFRASKVDWSLALERSVEMRMSLFAQLLGIWMRSAWCFQDCSGENGAIEFRMPIFTHRRRDMEGGYAGAWRPAE